MHLGDRWAGVHIGFSFASRFTTSAHPLSYFHLFTTTPGAPDFHLRRFRYKYQSPASRPRRTLPCQNPYFAHLLIIPHASLFAVLPLTELDVTAVNDPKGSISESQSRVTSCRIYIKCISQSAAIPYSLPERRLSWPESIAEDKWYFRK
jgi:hypothetical protein